MRRGLFVDYLDIVGPFNPSTAPSASYTKIFICSQTTPQCAKTILSSLMERAYRRPVTDEEMKSKLDLVGWRRRKATRSRKASDWRCRRFCVAEFPVPHRAIRGRARRSQSAPNVFARMQPPKAGAARRRALTSIR